MSRFDALFKAAKAARDNAHAPYSGFRVGAALLTEGGHIVAGCNVENAAYPEGTCAEAGAIAAMVCAGETRILEALVVADAALCTPCGGCRQKLKEFADGGVKVHIADLQGLRRTFTLEELLPFGFEFQERD
ncbi:cytidine deaminase [Polymorphum gilvum]|uniref:Cytidine deaminase n=1 Tax=Polymorphum gilvum (strain LMG 25793 / CGMCC 1.9160 / SL003B-26A1) TaxID=991905 RepID=F2J2T5_POLGS|nr:cytidine deaminase [Polymorphum gilvum]ADZ72109.1 Cytidine deaminase protein [Polymorphum gilvum SL003B-26A1]